MQLKDKVIITGGGQGLGRAMGNTSPATARDWRWSISTRIGWTKRWRPARAPAAMHGPICAT
jgi:hypothetical protein